MNYLRMEESNTPTHTHYMYFVVTVASEPSLLEK